MSIKRAIRIIRESLFFNYSAIYPLQKIVFLIIIPLTRLVNRGKIANSSFLESAQQLNA